MPPQFLEVQRAAQRSGLESVSLDISFPAGIDAGFVAARQAGVGAVVILSDSSTIAHRSQLSMAAAKYHMPTMFSNRDYIRAGGLMNYGPNLSENFRRAASILDKILKGASPALIPAANEVRAGDQPDDRPRAAVCAAGDVAGARG
jgi:putative ABC transport system substrate-binding protein